MAGDAHNSLSRSVQIAGNSSKPGGGRGTGDSWKYYTKSIDPMAARNE